MAEAKAPTPKFDLLASNFPPLPGSSSRMPGELVLESRMSDVVKGVYKEKVNTETCNLLSYGTILTYVFRVIS